MNAVRRAASPLRSFEPLTTRFRTAAGRDLLWLGAVSCAAYLVAHRLDAFEALVQWTRAYEDLQLDELFSAALVLIVGLVIFAVRRWRDVEHALAHREATDDARIQATAEAARMEGAFLVARTVAHEVNNALAHVVGYADLLSSSPALASDAHARRCADLIVQSAQEAGEKIHRIQRISQLELAPDDRTGFPILDLQRSTMALRN
jgi:signal transduction histidine kinase